MYVFKSGRKAARIRLAIFVAIKRHNYFNFEMSIDSCTQVAEKIEELNGGKKARREAAAQSRYLS